MVIVTFGKLVKIVRTVVSNVNRKSGQNPVNDPEESVLYLSNEDYEAFLKLLEEPARSIPEKLRRAAERIDIGDSSDE